MTGVAGTVVSVSGETITVNGRNGTTYAVDATNAKILKAKNNITLADIKAGDVIRVNGKVSGTNVIATVIRDGVPVANGKKMGNFNGVHGTVNSVSGTTITLTNEKGTVYTIDASNAVVRKDVSNKITKVTTADVLVGDSVTVTGAVNGNAVTAKTIFDGKFKAKVLKNKVAPAGTN